VFSIKKTLYIFLTGFLSCYPLFAADNEVLAERFLSEGKILAEAGRFDESIRILNRGMGLLKEFSPNHPLRLSMESQLKITKGKFLVSRYDKLKQRRNVDTVLLPLKDENKDFMVSQVFGKVSSRQVWLDRPKVEFSDSVGLGRRLTVFPNSGVELTSLPNRSLILRSLDASTFELKGQNNLLLYSGTMLVGAYMNNSSFALKSPNSEITLNSSKPFSVMMGVTTNGGVKIIVLLGEVKLISKKQEMKLMPGELCFALPDGLSRKMTIELSTLMVTSKLLTGFDKPLPFASKLKQQAMMQALRTRQRYRTVVGDVKGVDEFEIKVLEEIRP
jgi:hypothetical protein